MITVYGYPKTRATRITWLLEELQQDYQFKRVNFAKGENRSAEFLAINPAGKVPAMQDDNLLMTESGAIVTYLADKYAAGTLIPAAGTNQRGRYEQWSYFSVCELEQGLWSIGKHKFALPEEQRVPDMINTGAWEFQKALALLSKGLGEQDYILGEQFSAVDILLVMTLHWALAFKQPIEADNVKAYYQRVINRPAFKAAWEREQQGI
ncbi:MAG: glutathione S-transferase family protein [Pseudomonadales bacterium]|nr:glutathione S-transferase family protein [Pseudomonadales bacterium]